MSAIASVPPWRLIITAKRMRLWARMAFQAGDYLRAKDLYLETEQRGWAVPGPYKDIAFFAAGRALRCYEHLLGKHPELVSEYRACARRFFARYGDLACITGRARSDARTFLYLRWHRYNSLGASGGDLLVR
jgi:hypothetical protein